MRKLPMWISALVGLLLVALLRPAALASEGSLMFPVQTNGAVELTLTKQDSVISKLSGLLQVFVGSADNCCANRTPVAGRYETNNGRLKFVPLFAFVPGQDYTVRVSRHADEPIAQPLTEFKIPTDSATVTAEVTTIYPRGDMIPENVLRFYIHFSTPMQPHVAHDFIKLVNTATGKADDAAFMKFKQELWSEDRKRLTVLMDPGRIKRNVATNRRLGPALQKGETYKIVVTGGWPAASGRSSLDRYEKSFTVSAPLRERPDLKHWAITQPASGSKETLQITFDRPFDYQLLHSDIRVSSASGNPIDGVISTNNHATQWRFQPKNAWAGKQITLIVDSELEDVAGNNLRELLDHAIGTEPEAAQRISISVNLSQE